MWAVRHESTAIAKAFSRLVQVQNIGNTLAPPSLCERRRSKNASIDEDTVFQASGLGANCQVNSTTTRYRFEQNVLKKIVVMRPEKRASRVL
jgi:hypothetical protein